jgi:hypothetical protein
MNYEQSKERLRMHWQARKSLVGVSGVRSNLHSCYMSGRVFFLLLLNSLLAVLFLLKTVILMRHYIECPVTCFTLCGKTRDLAPIRVTSSARSHHSITD